MITEETLQAAIAGGATTAKALRLSLGMGGNCGCCAAAAQQYINRHCQRNCDNCPGNNRSSR